MDPPCAERIQLQAEGEQARLDKSAEEAQPRRPKSRRHVGDVELPMRSCRTKRTARRNKVAQIKLFVRNGWNKDMQECMCLFRSSIWRKLPSLHSQFWTDSSAPADTCDDFVVSDIPLWKKQEHCRVWNILGAQASHSLISGFFTRRKDCPKKKIRLVLSMLQVIQA